jgi:cullin 3
VLHRSVYKLVINRHGDILYDGVTNSIAEHVSSWLQKLLVTPSEQFLPLLTAIWGDHAMMTSRIREILLYSEKNFVSQSKKMPVYDMGLLIFRDKLVLNEAIKGKLTHELLRCVAQERAGLIIDRDSIRTTLSMLLELGIHGANLYEDLFEKLYLDETKFFYQSEIQSFLAENTCSICLQKIESRLQEEARHAQHYLPLSTGRKLNTVMETELIEDTASTLIYMERSGVGHMLREDKREDLKLMFSVLCRVPSTLDHLRECFSEYVVTMGGAILTDVTSTKDYLRFVQENLLLKKRMASIVADCFSNEPKFQNNLKQSFDIFLNKDSSLTASYLAMYSDEQLRNGFRSLTDSDIEACIDGVVTLLSHVHDKDIFESYYKSYLTKRLMGAKSISEEIEKQVISKLKSEYGYQFTSKLERMFSDMNISRSIMHEYKESVLDQAEYRSAGGLDCDFTMLTAGYWPAQKHDDSVLQLPPVIQLCKDRFSEFYLHKHNARRISWQFSLGSADLKMTLANGRVRHDLNVSTYQMLILYLFNEQESVSYASIAAAVVIPELELKRHLLSLCNPKLKILVKASAGKVRSLAVCCSAYLFVIPHLISYHF